MSSIKAVVFDLDGTLLDREKSVQKFIENQYDRIVYSQECVNKMDYIARFIELDRHGYTSKGAVYKQLSQEFDFQNVSFESLVEDYMNQFKYSCVPFQDSDMMLKELKRRGYKLGIITNGYGRFQMDNIKKLGIAHLFTTIVISEWEGLKKPDSDIFLLALERLEVSPSEAIFIGDHPINDIQASNHIGMTSVWKRTDIWGDIEILPDFTIDELSEILSNPMIINN